MPVAGNSFTTNWSTTNATSLTRVCTAGGTGFKVNESLPVNSQRSQTALAAWVAYPSSCIWTAIGPGGARTYTETLRTDPEPVATPKPTILVRREPKPVEEKVFTTTWQTTNATALSRVCTAGGAGYKVNESLPVSSSRTETALVGWAANPSSCTWTATGAGGTTTYSEIMETEPKAGGNVTYIHTDGLGSPVARTNASKQVISRTRYEPYGYVAAGAQPTIGFTGHVNDSDTGLTYMQQRYYDPVAGRFLSIDPVTTDANSGDSFNRYVYANNNPYSYIDPDGRQAMSPTLLMFPADSPKSKGNPAPGLQTIGATKDFLKNYNNMVKANTHGADKFFHCKANCEATRRGTEGNAVAIVISETRELVDQKIKGDEPSASAADQVANQHGRNAGSTSGQSCSQACEPFRPPTLKEPAPPEPLPKRPENAR